MLSSPSRSMALAFCAIVFAAAHCLLAADNPITPEEIARGFRARTLLAKPKEGARAIDTAEAKEKLTLLRAHARFGGVRTLETDGSADVKDVIARLAATGLYEYVEPDFVRRAQATPDDPSFASEQWSLNNTGQAGGTAGADIKAVAAWDIQHDAADVIVAIIDSGMRYDHEDLQPNVWRNAAELSGRTNLDDDGDGYIDDVFGINATVAKTSLQAGDPWDDDGHGSHVAGIIGAVGNNGKGISGVAWKVQLMPLKFLGARGSGSVSGAIACIDYAIAKKAQIINGSFSSAGFSQAEFDALKRARDAGIIFVAAAGNDSQEITDLPQYPAAYRLDNIVAVASTTRQDKLASYSAFGSGLVDLAAPGSSILSAGYLTTTAYVTESGTSMAAPHVTGALALLRQKFPNDNYRALINRLLGAVDILPDLDHKVHTNGRLNLLRALNSTDTRPFNDDFARRATITGDFNTVRGSNQFATTEAGEPDHGVAGASRSLWWSWTAPKDVGKVTISTAGSEIDTVLAVYTSSAANPALGTLQRVAFNDDADGATTSSLSLSATDGTSYYIAVAGKAGAEGLVTFNLTTVPINDAFAQAKLLVGPSVVVEANNTFATVEPGEPAKPRSASNRALGIDHTLWFKWIAPETRPYQISAYGTTTDPIISIYGGANLASLTEVTSDDDGGPQLDSLARFTAAAGGTYYIRVDTSAGAGGRFTLSLADAAWQYVSDYPGYTSPAIAPDRTIYYADGLGLIHAINPDGTRKWRSTVVDGFMEGGSLAVAPDGSVIAADDEGTVYALSASNGSKKWSFATGDLIWAAPAIAADGTIYVKSDDNLLYALNPDGTKKWTFNVQGDTYSAPTIATDGTIYIAAGGDSALYAVNPDGTQKWRANLEATVYASPALGADGTIFLGNYDGRFFALRPDGSEKWHFDTGSPLSGSAVIDAAGTVYFGSYDHKLYALDGATGAKKWDYATGDTILSTAPVLADDGTIYIGSNDGLVHALSTDGKLRRTYATAAEINSSPVLAAGRLYVSSLDAKLYAFDTGNNLATSPWPMHRQNLRRIGRATTLTGIPRITAQPTGPANVTAGSPVSLTAAATITGPGTVKYQWLFNDVPIDGATSATLVIPSAQGSNAGTYRVLAIGPDGDVISGPTTLTVAAAATDSSRLVNLAVRTTAGSGDRVLFVGFAVGGAGTIGTKPLLVRAVGPTLGAFGVTGVLADPKLQMFSGTTLALENDDWAGNVDVAATTPQVGAFALAATTSKDAAVVTSRPIGAYTAQVSGPGTDIGVVLAEIYDATPANGFTATTPRLVNVSARTLVGTGSNVLIAGFAIGGTSAKAVLIRAIGPTLGNFGVTGVLADPRLDLFAAGNTTAISSNDNWGAASNATQVAAAAASVGAFPLTLESKDAVLLVTLPPGSYTAQVSGAGNTTGAAIVEVYEVP